MVGGCDFGLPSGAGGAPFAGPFVAAIAYGLRAANSEFPPAGRFIA